MLDERAILAAWSDWQAIGTYNLAERSCCACVHALLEAGGLGRRHGQRFTSTVDGRRVVSPEDLALICAYARTRLFPERAPSMSASGPLR